jgi:hypothetical protein
MYDTTLSSIDYEMKTQKVYPSPGDHVVTINFELPKYTESLKMSVRNVLGQTMLIPIENGIFRRRTFSSNQCGFCLLVYIT